MYTARLYDKVQLPITKKLPDHILTIILIDMLRYDMKQ